MASNEKQTNGDSNEIRVLTSADERNHDVLDINGRLVTLDGDDILRKGLVDDAEIELTPEMDRAILWKIDLYLLPVMCLVYCFQYMDKLSNSYASILGLRDDLHMTGDKYSWTGSAFYLGYLAFEFPATWLLQRFNVGKTVGALIVVWGVVLCLHSVPNYAGFVALRTILGALESGVTPAFTIITAQYYRADETYLRITCWFACNGLGNIIGSGAIAYNVSKNAESYSLEAWKLIFIICGSCTIFIGILVFFHLPGSPVDAYWLNSLDKRLVIQRIKSNQQGFGSKHFKKDQFIEALTDYKTWLFFLYAVFSDIPNGGVTNFGSIIMHGDLGFSTEDSLLYQMIGGAVEVFGCIFLVYFSRFYKSRMFFGFIGSCLATTAAFMLAFCKSSKARFAGYNLINIGPLPFMCLLSCIASNVTGHTKKFAVHAVYLIGYCVGNLIGPQTFKESDAPNYPKAKATMAACYLVSLVIILAIWLGYYLENKARDKKGEKVEIENIEFADLTDKQNPNFRYSY